MFPRHRHRLLQRAPPPIKYLKRYFPELFLRETPAIIQMPSTSPAAARLTYEQKFRAYEEVILSRLRQGGKKG